MDADRKSHHGWLLAGRAQARSYKKSPSIMTGTSPQRSSASATPHTRASMAMPSITSSTVTADADQ